MSTVFRTLFQASIVKGERIRAVSTSGQAESLSSSLARGREHDGRSFSFLMTTELSGWNVIEDL